VLFQHQIGWHNIGKKIFIIVNSLPNGSGNMRTQSHNLLRDGLQICFRPGAKTTPLVAIASNAQKII